MTFVQQTEHQSLALARVVEEFRRSPNFLGLLEVLVAPLQELDDSLWLLYTTRWPDLAEGVQLDALGGIVGQPREGRDDPTYRLWIKARVFVNRSTGTADDSLHVLQLVVPSATAVLTETPPAAYLIYSYGLTEDPEQIARILRQVKPAGVNMNFQYSPFPEDELFAFSSTGSLVSGDVDQGFGDSSNPATGGHLTGLL